MLSQRQEEILRSLKEQPFLKTSELEETLELTRARINQLIVPLIKKGFVKRDGRARATIYKITDKRSMDHIRRENWELRRRMREL